MPKRDAQGRTVWVTRQRPKVDRIACHARDLLGHADLRTTVPHDNLARGREAAATWQDIVRRQRQSARG